MQDPGSFTDVVSQKLIASDVMKNIMNRQNVGTLRIGARFRVVDTLFTPQNVMPANMPSFFPDVSDIGPLVAPDATITHDASRAVHKSLTFSMVDPQFIPSLASRPFPFNPLQNLIGVSQTFLLIEQNMYFEVPIAYFMMFLPTVEIHPGRRIFTWQGLDICGFIAQTPLLSDWTVTAGYPGGYLGAVKDILQVKGIPISLGGTGQTPQQGNDDAGPDVPNSLLDIDYVGNQPVASDTLFQAGTSRMDIVNQLLDAINYYPISADTKFRFRQKPYYGTGDNPNLPRAGWDYSTLAGSSIVDSPIQQDFNSQADTRINNITKVEGDVTVNTSRAYHALRQNTGLNNQGQVISAIGTSQLKSLSGGPRAIGRYEKANRMASQAMADLRAQILIQIGAQLPETITVNTLHQPLHEDHDHLILQVTSRTGSVMVPSSSKSLFVEEAWTLPLKASGGKMAHTLRRVVTI